MANNKKMKEDNLIKRVHNLFFNLSFVYKVSIPYLVVLWIIGKLMLVTPYSLLILYKTKWESASNPLAYLNMLYFYNNIPSAFAPVCFGLVGMLFVFSTLIIIRLIHIKGPAHFIDWILAYGFPLVSSVLTPMISIITSYLIINLRDGVSFSPYKRVPNQLVVPMSDEHLIQICLVGFSLLECIILDLLYILLFQDRTLTIWCSHSWKSKTLELLLKVTIFMEYILDTDDSYISLLGTIMELIQLGIVFFGFVTPLPYNSLHELSDLFVNNCLLILRLIVLIFEVNHVFSLDEHYQYILLAPVFGSLCCLIKFLYKKNIFDLDIRNEENALEFLRGVLCLCHKKDQASSINLYALLNIHRQTCFKPMCECRSLLLKENFLMAHKYETQLNHKAYEASALLPERITNSWVLKVLKICVSDIDMHAENVQNLYLALAEISHYYFGNFYKALHYIQVVESRKQSFIGNQYATNIRNVIEMGMWTQNRSAKGIITCLKFQDKYSKFLTHVEESCEYTVKFWSTLNEEKPDVDMLRNYGKELFEKRRDFFIIVQELTEINGDYTEFLVKLGLYMRLIMHDKPGATKVFQRIVWISESLAGKRLEDQMIFREDQNVLMIQVSLEQENYFAITKANELIEHVLGYKLDDLIKFSATKLMHPVIAKQHSTFVQQFFETMKMRNLLKERLEFIKHQEGFYVPCITNKKIVPTISGGLSAFMMFFHDKNITPFTSRKVDRTLVGV